jgi:glucokinase
VSVIAIDVGGTKVASAVVSEEGEILARRHALLGGHAGDDVAALVVEQCRALFLDGDPGGAMAPRAVGVAVPGIYREDRGTVWAPNIPGWDDYPLRDELQHALGSGVRVVVDSDRAAYILGETWLGAARGARDAIFLAVGTGIGAGILVDGRVLRGHADIAGAIGWLALDRPYLDRYVSCGCFEYHASGPGLTNVVRDLLVATPDYDGELRRVAANELSTAHVFEAFDRRDPIARHVLDDAVQFWAMATANVVSLFNPETIVFGGGVFGPAVRFLDRIREEARQWAQPIAMQQVQLVGSTLGGDAGLLGAARLANIVVHASSRHGR